jgi:hypothetical protein
MEAAVERPAGLEGTRLAARLPPVGAFGAGAPSTPAPRSVHRPPPASAGHSIPATFDIEELPR